MTDTSTQTLYAPARRRFARHATLPLAALAWSLAASGRLAHAHEGHDHDPGPATLPAGSGPRRLADGSVWLPKPSQRALALRTQVAVRAAIPLAAELPGRVVIDPAAGGQVQSTLAGRLEPGPRGLPSVGSRVRRGEVLAVVRPTVEPLARAANDAQLAELRAAQVLAQSRLTRLRELSDSVPRKDIDAARSEVAALDGRIRALSAGPRASESLVAPVDGVIASADAIVGQVVDPRTVLFLVVDPTRLRIEASTFDATLAGDVASASIVVGGRSLALAFVGAARVLREQAVPLAFRATDPLLAGLSVDQVVSVTVQRRTAIDGLPVPAAALVRDAANQPIVWVKLEAERFAPRSVRYAPVDGARIALIDGVAADERVVVVGAPLLNQVR